MADQNRPDSDADLRDGIVQSRNGDSVNSVLETDAQVIARVTDGIYRQPASAFRELISNAFDADATEVVIQTDRPRFQRISVSDNGNGMGPAAVAHLIRHIGGSAKRSKEGVDLGITKSVSDPSLSPGGRRLIGKVGIGLFSVSQLTQSFQIVTKLAGDPWRTVASVKLRQYSENEDHIDGDPYEAGLVTIWQEPATDVETKGTTIILNGLKPAARETLRSAPMWLRARRQIQDAPNYHVGAVVSGRDHEFEEGVAGEARLPWSPDQSPSEAFESFVSAVTDPDSSGLRSPKITDLLDYYLQMVWQLSLAAPLPYVDQHPFDDNLADARRYVLDGPGPSGVTPIHDDEPLGRVMDWPTSVGTADSFRVVFDDLELRRPLKFRDLAVTSNAVKSPMIFAGHLRDEFPDLPESSSGGPLEFYAYLLWMPKVVPTDDIGSLIRIYGASGTGFDETFLKYQVAETTRLKQISCEVFVVEGLEGALNIDRESYNYSHTHVVRLTNRLHTALSRSINVQKSHANVVRREHRRDAANEQVGKLETIVNTFWDEALGSDADSPIPPVTWGDAAPTQTPPGANDRPEADAIRLSRREIIGTSRSSERSRKLESKVAAIVQILSAMELLEDLDQEQLDALLSSIAKVLTVDE